MPRTRSYLYPLLNDAEWLRRSYLIEKRSTREIARLAGAKTSNSARQALLRNGIAVRDMRTGMTCRRSDDQFVFNRSVIEGCLLGDGSLHAWNVDSTISCPYFKKKNKGLDHVTYVAGLLFADGGQSRITRYESRPQGKSFTDYTLRSLSHEKLVPLWREWYPPTSAYRKVIPETIQVDRDMLLHWFLDDGSSYQRRPDSRTKQVYLTLSSEAFEREHQEMLCEKIRAAYEIRLRIRRVAFGTGWRIEVPQSQTQMFYETIGPCPVPSMAYKWK